MPFGIRICSSNRNHNSYLWRLPNITILTKVTLPNWKGFNWIYATGLACQQGTLTPPDTWFRPIWDLHIFYLLRPILFPNLSLFVRTMHFKHPSVLSPLCILRNIATNVECWRSRTHAYFFFLTAVTSSKYVGYFGLKSCLATWPLREQKSMHVTKCKSERTLLYLQNHGLLSDNKIF